MTTPNQSGPPQNIRAHSERGILEVTWTDDKSVSFPFRFLRGRCPCASCVNENTGQRTFDVEQADENVKPVGMEMSGNYAFKIQWSDEHNTGLFTWEYLRKLEEEAKSYR